MYRLSVREYTCDSAQGRLNMRSGHQQAVTAARKGAHGAPGAPGGPWGPRGPMGPHGAPWGPMGPMGPHGAAAPPPPAAAPRSPVRFGLISLFFTNFHFFWILGRKMVEKKGRDLASGPCWLHPGRNSVRNAVVVTSNGGMATRLGPDPVFLGSGGVPRRPRPPMFTFSAGGGA